LQPKSVPNGEEKSPMQPPLPADPLAPWPSAPTMWLTDVVSSYRDTRCEGDPMLTAKQEKFALSIHAGKSQADAYRDAYDAAAMQDATVWAEASKLMRHPKVSTRVDVLKAEAEAVRRVLVLDREEAILARLEHEALNAKSDSARIRALELLGKAAGLFTEKIEIEQVERSAEAIERDIRQRLQRLGLVKAE
jgi:hypothetical protein